MLDNPYNKKINEITTINSQDFGFHSEGAIVNNREDLKKIIEEPCLKACLFLYDRNIRTVNSSANKKDIGGQAYIGIHYDSLDEKNKKILERLIEEGIIEKPKLSENQEKRGGRDVMVYVPVFEDDTVGKVSDRFMQKVSSFQEQDVLFGRKYAEPLMQEMIDIYSEFLHPNENGEVEVEEVIGLVKNVYGYVYDSELNIFWESQELYNKHKKFQEKTFKTEKEKEDKPELSL